MNLDIREMTGGELARLRYIKRFSTCRTVGTETVAEHTAFVVIYCLLIMQWARANRPEMTIDGEKLLARAALHDAEESRTGDFPRSFKYSTPELKHAVDEAAKLEATAVFEALVDDGEASAKLYGLWLGAKDASPEGCILEFADFLSALAFVVEEKKTGNFCLSQHTGTFTQYLAKFDGESYQFLRPLVHQARKLVVEVLA